MRYIIVFALCLLLGIIYGMNLRMNDIQSKLDSYVDCIDTMDSEIVRLNYAINGHIKLNKTIIQTNTKLHNELIIANSKLKGLN